MGIVKWDGSLVMGIETVDVQHEELFRVINSMFDKMVKGRDKHALVEGLDSLRSYVKYHFRTEEALMDKYDYPGLDDHRREHEIFAERMDLYAERPLEQSIQTLEEMQTFLLNWLVKHIQRADRKYADYFREQGVILPRPDHAGR